VKALGLDATRALLVRADEMIKRHHLLQCMSPVVMWWTAPAPGDESP
jgi:hypothetical protein